MRKKKSRKQETDSSLEELYQYILDRCAFLLSPETPAWYGGLIVRAVFEVPSSVQQMGIQFFSPDFECLEQLMRQIKPDLDGFQIKLWTYSIVGQIFFYVFGRNMILMANGPDFLAADRPRIIARHIYELSVKALESDTVRSCSNP
jgi:hypothetical protein